MTRTLLKLTLFIALLFSLNVALVGAQDGLTQTFASDDGTISLNYPDGWFATSGDQTAQVILSNVELENPSNVASQLEPGATQIVFYGLAEMPGPETLPALPEDSSFIVGYLTGVLWTTDVITAAFSGADLATVEPLQIGEISQIEVGPYQATLVDTQYLTDRTIIVLQGEGAPFALIVNAAPGELDTWRETALAIAATLVYQPEE
jgi:hypothetical protein